MMKNNVNKKSNNMKKLIPAAGMLAVSATMLATSTYAWFSMNTQVTAQGMSVKAQAEGGIVIANSGKTTWSSNASSTLATVTSLLPTSTKNLTAWFHGTSSDPSSANASSSTVANNASTITLKNSGNLGYYDEDGDDIKDDNENAYYLVTDYYIKSTTAEALQTSLYIKSVSVSSTTSNTAALNGALRVAIKYGDSFTTIYGSTASSTLNYYVGAQTSEQTTINAYNAQNVQITGVTSIANTDAGATKVQVYVWYEGEDTNCLSNNIAGLTPDDLNVSVVFSTTNV